MEILIDSFRHEFELLLQVLPRLFMAVLLLGVFAIVGKVLQRGAALLLARSHLDRVHRRFFERLVFWIILLLGLSLAAAVLGLSGFAAGILASGGVAAIILGFAFKEIGENFLAGLFLAFSRPFKVGDLIAVEDIQGTVEEIELRYTHIRTADGRDIYIPNARIFTQAVTNFTRDGLRRFYFRVGIDYGDDSEAARALLGQAVAGVPGVLAEPPPAAHIVELAPQYLVLEVRYWVDAFEAPVPLAVILSTAMNACRQALIEAGFTLSSDVTNSVRVSGGLAGACSAPPNVPETRG